MSDVEADTEPTGDGEARPSLLSGRLNRAIALFALVMLCLMWGGVAWVIAQDRRQTIAEAMKDTRNLARAFDEHIASIVSGLDHLVQLVQLQFIAHGDKLDLPDLVEHLQVPSSVLQVGILDNRGHLLHSNLPYRPLDLSDREYYRFHRDQDTDGLHISKPVYGRLSSKQVLQLSRRINASDGSFAGVVMLSLDPQYFAAFYREMDLGRGGLVTVIGTDGIVRARQDADKFTLGQDARDARLFQHIATAREGTYVSHSPIDGTRRYISYRALRDYPLVVVLGREHSEVLTFFFDRRRYLMMAGAAGTLLVLGSALWVMILSRRQSRHATELLNSQARLRAFMDSVPDRGWLKDRKGRFIAVNRAYERTIGRAAAEILGRTDVELFDKALAQQHMKGDTHVMTTGRMVRFETIIRHAGSARWMETIKVPVYDSRGIISGTCGLSRDITERKQAEADAQELHHMLERRAAELAGANRELDAYAYTVSHDLHAPLRHISGFTRLLRDQLTDYPDVRVQRLFEKVAEATGRMEAMIDDLLAFSRSSRSVLRSEPVALNAVVADIVDEFRSARPERSIRWRVDSLPDLNADRNLVQLAFYNVISNAVKYTATRPASVIEIASLDRGPGEVVVYVRDNGVGFDMKDADRLFGVFERLHDDREFKGSGIGLATVKRIVERHGGRVWAEGNPGIGATFYMAMPQGAPSSQDLRNDSEKKRGAPKSAPDSGEDRVEAVL